MKKTDIAVQIIKEDIENKIVLEVACGSADFSISASEYAGTVHCIDLDDTRLKGQTLQCAYFSVMDASEMSFPDSSFDTVVLYNAFFHIHTQWLDVEKECMRVLKEEGKIIIISTWTLESGIITETFGERAQWDGEFLIVKIKKYSFNR